VGALLFGMMADRQGRRIALMIDIVFYAIVEFLSGLAPSYAVFMALRLLYGIGMGGEWGVGASLTIESVPAKWRGFISGLLQEGYACGFLLATLVTYTIFPRWGWRPLFFIGGLPALLSLFIRAKVKEPEAWHRSRTDWRTYRREILANWRRFLYIVLLLACMSSISHGTQDMYPTFLKRDLHFSVRLASVVTAMSMVGALVGGMVGGMFSQRGRRRAVVASVLIAAALIPLWITVRQLPLIIVGAFLMQFMVQSAWGVIPAHINELSPDRLRGFFPGFAYQLGVLCASGIAYFEALVGEHFSYAAAMGVSMAVLLVLTAVVTWLGPERRGVVFGASQPSPGGGSA